MYVNRSEENKNKKKGKCTRSEKNKGNIILRANCAFVKTREKLAAHHSSSPRTLISGRKPKRLRQPTQQDKLKSAPPRNTILDNIFVSLASPRKAFFLNS